MSYIRAAVARFGRSPLVILCKRIRMYLIKSNLENIMLEHNFDKDAEIRGSDLRATMDRGRVRGRGSRRLWGRLARRLARRGRARGCGERGRLRRFERVQTEPRERPRRGDMRARGRSDRRARDLRREGDRSSRGPGRGRRVRVRRAENRRPIDRLIRTRVISLLIDPGSVAGRSRTIRIGSAVESAPRPRSRDRSRLLPSRDTSSIYLP